MTIRQGLVTYSDGNGRVLQVDRTDAHLSLGGSSGPFKLTGQTRLGDDALTFDGAMDRLSPDRAAPVTMTVRLPGSEAKAEFSGLISRLSTGETARGRLTLAAPDLGRALSALDVSLPVPQAAPLAVDTEISLAVNEMALTNLVASVGDTRATGTVSASLGAVPQVDVRMAVAGLDLDKWQSAAPAPPAQPAARSPVPPTDAPAPGAAAPAPGGFALPNSVFVSAALSLDALSWHGQVVRDMRAEAVLDQGEVVIGKLSALLPGGSTAAAEGTVTAEGGRPVFDGQITLHADNLRTVLAWAGIEPAAVPENRLRMLDLVSPMRVAWPEMRLSNFRLSLDASKATGTLTARLGSAQLGSAQLGDRPAFGLNATIDSVNLDSYTAPAAPAATQPHGPAATGSKAETAAAAPPSAPAANFDADMKLAIQTLVVRETAAEGIALDAQMHGGELTLRHLTGDLDGTQIKAQGRILGLADGAPRLDRLAVQLASPQPARLFRLLGIKPPVPPERLTPLAAAATVSGDVNGKVMDIAGLTLSAGPSRLTGQGRMDLSGAKPRITAELSANTLALDSLLGSERTGMLLPGSLRLPPSAVPPINAAVPVAAVGAGQSPFSREKLDLSALHGFNAQIAMKAEAVTAKGWRLDQPAVQLAVQDGNAAIEQMTGKLQGGDMTLSAALSAGQVPALSGRITITGADVGAARLGAAGIRITQGKLNSEARFATSGGSSQEMASRLNGNGTLLVKNGIIDGFDLPAVNQRLNNIDNLGSLLGIAQTGLSGGQTPFSQLAGTFRADNGVVATNDLKLDAEGGSASAQSSTDLSRWTTNTRIAFQLANAAQAPLAVRLEGPLDNPRKIVDVNALQQHLVSRGLNRALKGKDAGAVLEGLIGKGGQQPAPSGEEQSDTPREKNTGKAILRDLLKGLGGR